MKTFLFTATSIMVQITSRRWNEEISNQKTQFCCFQSMVHSCMRASSPTAGYISGSFSISLPSCDTRRNTSLLEVLSLDLINQRISTHFYFLDSTILPHSKRKDSKYGMRK